MKIIQIIIVFIVCSNCCPMKNKSTEIKSISTNFENVTHLINPKDYKQIIAFILKKGDRMTYRNIDSNNPHYRFKKCDVFLSNGIAQLDYSTSNSTHYYNQITITDWKASVRYFELIMVQVKDLTAKNLWLKPEMKSDEVYLMHTKDHEIEMMKKTLSIYLEEISKEIKANEK